MKRLFAVIVLALVVGGARANCEPVTLIGSFSNMYWSSDDDPHLISGYEVNLFRCLDRLFGDVGVATGSIEGVSGRMYDIAYDPKSGHLRFKTKYSEGWEGSKEIGPAGREARTFLSFDGKVTKTRLLGTITLRDAYSPTKITKRIFVSMKRSRDRHVPRSEEEWSRYRAELPDW